MKRDREKNHRIVSEKGTEGKDEKNENVSKDDRGNDVNDDSVRLGMWF